jgi:hypothetical protein
MDTLKKLSLGSQVTLGAGVLFLIFSFFNWFEVKNTSYGESMWHGVGVIAGLLLIVVLIWEALRFLDVKIELGISPTMIGMGLALLLLLFTFIRFIDKPGGGIADSFVERTVWSWLGLILAIVLVAGAWLHMQAAGESLADVRAKVSSVSTRSSDSGTTSSSTATAPPATPPATPPSEPETPEAPPSDSPTS